MSKDLVPGPPPTASATTPARPAPTVPGQDGAASGPKPRDRDAVPTVDDRAQAFKPVAGGTEMQSGEKLLVEAYAAIWIILFALVMLSWRRQRQIEARITSLEGAIDKARAESAPHKGGS